MGEDHEDHASHHTNLGPHTSWLAMLCCLLKFRLDHLWDLL